MNENAENLRPIFVEHEEGKILLKESDFENGIVFSIR